MKRHYLAALAMLAVSAIATPALAALRFPQVPFNSAALQSRLNGFGESINVATDQQDALVWRSSVSGNTTMTIQYQVVGNPTGDSFGISRIASNAPAGLCEVFPSAGFQAGWFALASFRPDNSLVVTLFNSSAAVVGTTTYLGVNRTLFAYYLKNNAGTFYSHEGYNADGKVHALVYAGTGANAGCWWMSWEDTLNPSATADYDDGLVFIESVNPTPVQKTTWGTLKQRFR